MVALDPLASLRAEDIDVTIGGQVYTLEGRPAAVWLECLMTGDVTPIIPGWLGSEAEDLILERLADDEITADELNEVTKDVISVAAGRPWWWAMYLISYACLDVHHWSRVNGALVLAGVKVDEISLSAWVDAAYVILTDKMAAGEEYNNFKMQIDTPPTPDLLDEEEEAAAFMSMLG
jgi:hypothetical protein